MIRPTEVKAVAAILEQPHETPEAAARTVIEALDMMRRERVWFVVAVNATPVPFLYNGWFSTNGAAIKWVGENALNYSDLQIGVIPMYSVSRLSERHTSSHHGKLMNARKSA